MICKPLLQSAHPSRPPRQRRWLPRSATVSLVPLFPRKDFHVWTTHPSAREHKGTKGGVVRRSFRPRLEALEDRFAPATLHWSGGGGDSLITTASNFLEQQAANAGDTLIFDGLQGTDPNKNAVIPLNGPSSFAAITLAPTYTGGLTISRDVSVTDFQQNGQTVTVDLVCQLTAHHYALNSGTITGGGILNISGGPHDPGTLFLPALPNGLANTISVATTTIGTDSEMTIAAPTTLNTNLTSDGTITWNDGNITVGLTNTITSRNDFLVFANGRTMDGGGTLRNEGLIVVDVGANGWVNITDNLVQTDALGGFIPSIWVQEGELTLSGGGTLDATIQTDAGATTKVSLMTGLTCQDGAAFTGGGAVIVDGDLIVAANVTVGVANHLTLNGGGRLMGPGSLAAMNGFVWENGSLDNLQMTVTGATTIQHVAMGATRTVTNSTLHLNGPTSWLSGNIAFNSGEIANRGMFTISANAVIAPVMGQPGGTFSNRDDAAGRGTITKTTAGTATFDVFVWSAGNILANGNTLAFSKDLIQQPSGMTNLGNNGTIDLIKPGAALGTFFLAGTLLGSGTIKGNLHNDGLVRIGGNVGGNNTLTVNGSYSGGLNATLEIRAGSAQSWGLLDVKQGATLTNTSLQVVLVGAYNPVKGTKKQVMKAANGFGGTSFASIPSGWNVTYTNGVEVEKQ